MKKVRQSLYVLGAIAVVAVVLVDIIFLRTRAPISLQNVELLNRRLTECGSYPIDSTQTIQTTSRVFINIPKDIYPNVNLGVVAHGASVGVVSNGGQYGYALGADQKPNCWSYYLEFNGEGTVDLSSKSASSSIPDYMVHFIVASSTIE